MVYIDGVSGEKDKSGIGVFLLSPSSEVEVTKCQLEINIDRRRHEGQICVETIPIGRGSG